MGKYDYLRDGAWVAEQKGTRSLRRKEATGYILSGCLNLALVFAIVIAAYLLFG